MSDSSAPDSPHSPPAARRRTTLHDAPPSNRTLLGVAVVLLALPIVALMLVNTYAKKEPTLWGFPFFIWYQFLWVFLCSGCTYAAYRLVLVARPHRPMNAEGTGFVADDDPEAGR